MLSESTYLRPPIVDMAPERALKFSTGVSPKPSPQAQPCYSWLDALAHVDVDGMAANLTDDYVHEMLPRDPTYPVLGDKKACVEFWTWLMPNFGKFIMTVDEVKEKPGEVVFQAASNTETLNGFNYRNRYTITFSVAQQPDGSYRLTHGSELFADTEQVALLRRDLGDL
ncbi:hypothetical protein EIP91_011800 [Steccherinum ochraceum]|uniref:SnoaL-like domain-containing protein n=1 Tax=Steccherinum ochraceum TaxID=92696 RepID=A0A4R0RK84_9APHY|nr:hypothetical protein EIP91_011800 [Steccherinum ochraceum]